ncbi:MAG: ABC transporter ATP-binding protein [Candidatus Hydrogenedentota bacterium]
MSGALVAEGVSFEYVPGDPVFRNVDCRVSPGRLVGIVGPNGSGKSTLLRVLCGLLKPLRGCVTANGTRLTELSHRERARRVAFLPQSVNPVFSMTCMEVVCLGRFPHLGALGALSRHDAEVAERCLRETASWDLCDRDFQSLSGGERQRVLLASILAQEAEFLLLDEPTSALDIHHQVEIFAHLRRLSRDRFGVAVVTHDLNLAARFCGHVLLMSKTADGFLAAGAPDEVFDEGTLSSAYGSRIHVSRHPITGAVLISADCAMEVS